MTLQKLKQELIDYARSIIPAKYQNFIQIIGTASQEYMQVQTSNKQEIINLVKKLFGQDFLATKFSKNYDIKDIQTVKSYDFSIESNNRDITEIINDKNINAFISEEKERVEKNLKIALYSNKSSINKFIKFIDNKHLFESEYFDFGENLENYKVLPGQTYDSSNPLSDWYKEIAKKLEHLVKLFSVILNIDFQKNYSEKPNGQGGRGKIVFKHYVLTGFTLPEFKTRDAFIKFQLTHLNGDPKFNLQIDLNWKKKDNPFKNIGEKVRDNSSVNYQIDDEFPDNWYDLIEMLLPKVKNLIDTFENKIINKNFSLKFQTIIDRYIEILKTESFDEVYKWKAVEYFQQNLSSDMTDYSNFIDKLLKIQKNIIDHRPKDTLEKLFKSYQYEIKDLLTFIYDEEIDLDIRYKRFHKVTDQLAVKYQEKQSMFNKPTPPREAEFAFLLSCRYPDKYYFYRDNYYQTFASFLNQKVKTAGEKYFHYLELIENFNKNYVRNNIQIQNLTEEFLKIKNISLYPNKNILAQSIIFLVDYYGWNKISVSDIKTNIMVKKNKLNQILYGPPGTGKTYNTINKAIEIINPDFDTNQDREIVKKEYDRLVEEGRIVFTTFHQSMSYEDFVEGIKPVLYEDQEEGKTDDISYEIKNGIFKVISKRAQGKEGNFNEKINWLKDQCSEFDEKEPLLIDTGSSKFTVSFRGGKTFRIKPEKSQRPDKDYPASIENIKKVYEGGTRRDFYNPTYVMGILNYLYKNGLVNYDEEKIQESQNFVLIIDEINRGNVSSIFGELITLIEEDKRIGGKEELRVVLPYSKDEDDKFGVPSNLYILGTMNTADRSVEALDTALRRRFNFIEMPPDYDVIKKAVKLKNGVLNLNGSEFNLAKLLKTINERIEILLDRDHLIGHSYFMEVVDEDSLKQAFSKQIIPLMQEYFYGDFGKIALVLGEGFCKGHKVQNASDIFANTEDYDTGVFDEKIIYNLIPIDNGFDIVSAVKILMKQL